MDNSNNNQNPLNPTPPPTNLPNSQPAWVPPAATDLNNPFPAPTPAPSQSELTPATPPTADSSPAANSGWPAMPSMPAEPAAPAPSTFTPPAAQPEPTSPSPLDNPWGSPAQTPPLDGTTTPMDTPTGSQPSWAPPTESAPGSDTAPTDLSHLISSNVDNGQATSSTTPETLVVPQTIGSGATPEATIPSQEHKSVPKWLIGIGVALLIIVTGTSAYFILGIGQPPKPTTSTPAEVSNPTIQTAPPVANPATQAAPSAATESANFGQIQSNQQATQATSAAELLKQRQQRK